jgi:hypothetical protein
MMIYWRVLHFMCCLLDARKSGSRPVCECACPLLGQGLGGNSVCEPLFLGTFTAVPKVTIDTGSCRLFVRW